MKATPINREELAGFLKASQKSRMCELLRRSGIRFVVDADGYPALTWEALNMQLAGNQAASCNDSQDDGFDLEALDRD